MEILDFVPAGTVEATDTVRFTYEDEGELIEEILTVKETPYFSCDDQITLDGYSHITGGNEIRFLDPDVIVEIVGEL